MFTTWVCIYRFGFYSIIIVIIIIIVIMRSVEGGEEYEGVCFSNSIYFDIQQIITLTHLEMTEKRFRGYDIEVFFFFFLFLLFFNLYFNNSPLLFFYS